MNDEALKQRIKYLVEHGGLWDDPLEDVRRKVRWAFALAGLGVVLSVVELSVTLLK